MAPCILPGSVDTLVLSCEAGLCPRVCLWRVSDCVQLASLRLPPHCRGVMLAAWSGDARRVALVCADVRHTLAILRVDGLFSHPDQVAQDTVEQEASPLATDPAAERPATRGPLPPTSTSASASLFRPAPVQLILEHMSECLPAEFAPPDDEDEDEATLTATAAPPPYPLDAICGDARGSFGAAVDLRRQGRIAAHQPPKRGKPLGLAWCGPARVAVVGVELVCFWEPSPVTAGAFERRDGVLGQLGQRTILTCVTAHPAAPVVSCIAGSVDGRLVVFSGVNAVRAIACHAGPMTVLCSVPGLGLATGGLLDRRLRFFDDSLVPSRNIELQVRCLVSRD